PGLGGGTADAEQECDGESDEARGVRLIRLRLLGRLIQLAKGRGAEGERGERRLEHRRRALVSVAQEFVDRRSGPRGEWQPEQLVKRRDRRPGHAASAGGGGSP